MLPLKKYQLSMAHTIQHAVNRSQLRTPALQGSPPWIHFFPLDCGKKWVAFDIFGAGRAVAKPLMSRIGQEPFQQVHRYG